jgi:hypothetical protein
MLIPATIISILLSAAVQGPPETAQTAADESLCQGEAISIYLPDSEGAPASNISLVEFQYLSHEDPCGRNITSDELMRLHAAAKALAASEFSLSEKAFSVFVKFTLTPNSPETLQMRASIPQAEYDKLGLFYDKAAALTDFHSSAGNVEVFFHYDILASSKSEAPGGAKHDR